MKKTLAIILALVLALGVLAGCAILEAIRRRWPSNRMRVADRGLREGLLTDMMADDGVWRRNRRRPPYDRER